MGSNAYHRHNKCGTSGGDLSYRVIHNEAIRDLQAQIKANELQAQIKANELQAQRDANELAYQDYLKLRFIKAALNLTREAHYKALADIGITTLLEVNDVYYSLHDGYSDKQSPINVLCTGFTIASIDSAIVAISEIVGLTKAYKTAIEEKIKEQAFEYKQRLDSQFSSSDKGLIKSFCGFDVHENKVIPQSSKDFLQTKCSAIAFDEVPIYEDECGKKNADESSDPTTVSCRPEMLDFFCSHLPSDWIES